MILIEKTIFSPVDIKLCNITMVSQGSLWVKTVVAHTTPVQSLAITLALANWSVAFWRRSLCSFWFSRTYTSEILLTVKIKMKHEIYPHGCWHLLVHNQSLWWYSCSIHDNLVTYLSCISISSSINLNRVTAQERKVSDKEKHKKQSKQYGKQNTDA